jgi:hypothetical protein
MVEKIKLPEEQRLLELEKAERRFTTFVILDKEEV